MRRREIVSLLIAAAAWPFAARAQPNGRIPVIGYLYPVSEADDRQMGCAAAFREGLRDLGYVEGENLRIEARYADRQFDQLKPLVAELVGLNVELIVTAGPGVLAAHGVTTKVPIVMAAYADPVAMGIVESLSHPGGNVTGLTFFWPELQSKRLELIKEVHPSLTRVGLLLLGRSDSPANRIVLDLANGTAAKLKIELMPIAVAGAGEVERALADAPGGPVGALVVDDAPTFLEDSAIIADVAQRRGLLSIGAPMFASAGGLLGYGVDFPPMWRPPRPSLDKILKGAKPGDLPIEVGDEVHDDRQPEDRRGARHRYSADSARRRRRGDRMRWLVRALPLH
jgi:putative tryptophan/tyrosine transport system substrate-binding protein